MSGKCTWPTHKIAEYWETVAGYVKNKSSTTWICSGIHFIYKAHLTMHILTLCCIGTSCRSKVLKLIKKFPQPADAAFSFARPSRDHEPTVVVTKDVGIQCDIRQKDTICIEVQTTTSYGRDLPNANKETETDDQTIDMDSISKLFSKHCKEIGLDVPNNFLKLSASAMINLRENNRENTVYNLVLGIGTMREDGSDSCFPVKRMPMGLVEYAASFFSVKIIIRLS